MLFFQSGMIFGLGAASIFYVTTGQCYFDVTSTFENICCSRNSTNPGRAVHSDEHHLLLEEGDSMSAKKMYGT